MEHDQKHRFTKYGSSGVMREYSNYSEAIAKYMVDKIISFAVSETFVRSVDSQIPNHCWEFTNKMITNYVRLEFIPVDRDDYNLSKEIKIDRIIPNLDSKLSIFKANSSITPKDNKKPSGIIKQNYVLRNFDSQNYQSLDSMEENNMETYNYENNTSIHNKSNQQHNIINEFEDEKMLTAQHASITNLNNSIIYYDNKLYGINDWSIIEQPNSCKIDRNASTSIKVMKNKNKKLKEEKSEILDEQKNPNPNEKKAHFEESKTVKSLNSSNAFNNLQNQKKKTYSVVSEHFLNYPIDNKFLPEREEENKEIEDLRKLKREEWKKKEEEVKSKQKHDRESQEKQTENVKKHKEYERKNVTTDINGNIIFIKPVQYITNDFLNAKFDILDKGEVNNILTLRSETNNETKHKKNNYHDKVLDTKGNKNDKKKDAKKVETITSNNNLNFVAGANERHGNYPITPAGSSFSLIMPEIGVTVFEGGQSKFGGGGRDYFKAFKKYSKYDYQTMLRETNVFSSTMKDFNIENLNVEYDINTKKDVLPNIGYNTRTENFASTINSKSKLTNDGSIKFNKNIGGSLRSALEGLEEVIFENEEQNDQNNENIIKIDPFKKKNNNNEERLKSMDEINKFNSGIVHNPQWGSNTIRGLPDKGENKTFYKPDLKNIEREVGKNIVKTKLPRARNYTYVKPLNSMNHTASGFGSSTLGKTAKSGKSNKDNKDNKDFNSTHFNQSSGKNLNNI